MDIVRIAHIRLFSGHFFGTWAMRDWTPSKEFIDLHKTRDLTQPRLV